MLEFHHMLGEQETRYADIKKSLVIVKPTAAKG